MAALIIYLLAGVGFAWALPGKPWQRALMIVVWMPLIAYGMGCQFIAWWRTHGYDYETDPEDPLP
jgi:hypothetical protein